MRRVRYQVAMSVDGYIADKSGGAEWIPMDPDIDFAVMFSEFDTLLMGRRTFEDMVRRGTATMRGMKTIVFSRTLQQSDYPEVTIVPTDHEKLVRSLREQHGKDIWLFGGGELFASFLNAGLVDTVEVAVVPVLLGGGVPLLPPPAVEAKLKLTAHKLYKSGIVLLEYAVR